MNKQERFDSQAQIDKTHCAKPAKLSRRERHWYRLKLRKLYRNLTGRITRDYLLTSDTLGHTVLIFLRALHISIEIADRIAPWADMREIDQAAAGIELTSYNVGYIIGQAIGLTWDQREKFKAWAFDPIEPDELIERLKADKRNKQKRDARTKRAVEIKATSRDPREAAVVAALDQLGRRPGASRARVADIIASIEKYGDRAAFPRTPASFRRLVYRTVDRLERDGFVRNDGFVMLCDHNVREMTPYPHANSLKYQGLVVTPDGALQYEMRHSVVPSNVVLLRPRTAPSTTAAPPSPPQKKAACQGGVRGFVPVLHIVPSPLHEVTSS